MGRNKFYEYVYPQNNGYCIKKDNIHYGYYEDIRDALHDRDNLVRCDWDLGEFVYIENENPYEDMELPNISVTHENQYIYPNSNGFMIRKSINGVKHYFGNYKTIEEARKYRDMLIECRWKI